VIVKYLKQKKIVQIKKIELNRVWPKMFVTLFRPSFCPAAKICNKIKFSFIGSPFGSTSFQLFAPSQLAPTVHSFFKACKNAIATSTNYKTKM
jgi:hypothetical protein